MAVWCDALLGQIRIGAAFEQQLYNVDMPAGGGVLQRRTGAYIVGHVFGDAVGQRRVLIEQLCHSFQIADACGRANVYVCAASAEMIENILRCGRDVFGDVSPSAIGVVTVSELNRTRAIEARCVDVRSARK